GKVTVALDNTAAINATQDDKSKSGSYLLDVVYEAFKEWQDETMGEVRLTIRWVPGHEGVAGNEAVDKEAKKAAQRKEDRGENPHLYFPEVILRKLPISRSANRQAYRATLKKQASESFEQRDPVSGETSKRCRCIRAIDPSAPSPKFMKLIKPLTRRQASVLMQLRSGHVPLQQYLYSIKRA
ncbi:hypothetical protein OF83DRAFT_1037246, partial [Amylostereum chailletii]